MDFHASEVASQAETHGKTHEIPVDRKSVMKLHASLVRLRSQTHGKAHEIPVAGKR